MAGVARDVLCPDDPGKLNRGSWARGRFVREYAHRVLRPVEVVLLVRYREDLSGRVLELGCGAGRITGYLVQLAREAYGIDLQPQMLAECRRRYPRGTFIQGDIRDLSRFEPGSLDAVIAGCNTLDIFSDEERRTMLREIRGVLRDGGLFVMSAHNRAYLPHVRGPAEIRTSDPLRFAWDLARAPRNLRRHRRLVALERDEREYAIVSDGAHGYSLVHYFITPPAQFRQLEEAGFEPISCSDLDGNVLASGDEAPHTVELHYAARCVAA
jgi:SAM-dependent methyltransferase